MIAPLPVIAYQSKGKGHIKYIYRMASNIFLENEHKIDFEVCILEACRRHRDYLLKIHKIQQPKPKLKRDGILWLNQATGKWEPMLF